MTVGIPTLKLKKILTNKEMHSMLRNIKDHCDTVIKYADDGKHSACELCNIKEFCYEQFNQDLPKDWDLSFFKKFK